MKIPGLGGSTGPKRPWLAALLALALTGLGHAYLRRWLRGLGWLAATYAVVLLFVPPETVETFGAGGTLGDPTAILPPFLVIVASAVDAYLLARRTRQRTPAGAAAGGAGAGSAGTGRPVEGGDGEALACPECGKELDAELDFCPWCTAELDRPARNGDRGDRGGDDGEAVER